jgi:hypothetical protein
MPPKSNPITVKIESQLCSRVEDMCNKIEKHMEKISLDPIKDTIIAIGKRVQALEDKVGDELREINNDIMNLVEMHWYDLRIQETEQVEELKEPVA